MVRSITRIVFGLRFWTFFVIPQVAFVIVAWLTDAANLIPSLNIALLALSAGVIVAYWPGIRLFFETAGPPAQGEIIILGIFLGWTGILINGGWAIVWRWTGMSKEFATTGLVSYFRFVMICAAFMHLMAPGALKDHIPTRQWITKGVIVAIIVFVAIMLVVAGDQLRDL